MHSNPIRWLHYAFIVVAIAGSMISLFALFELGAPSWTTPLNILCVLCALLAAKTRGDGTNSPDR